MHLVEENIQIPGLNFNGWCFIPSRLAFKKKKLISKWIILKFQWLTLRDVIQSDKP